MINIHISRLSMASLVAQLMKNPTPFAMRGTWVWSLDWEDPLLQYSGLEDSMDCIVHGVAKRRTQLSNFHSLTHSDWVMQITLLMGPNLIQSVEGLKKNDSLQESRRFCLLPAFGFKTVASTLLQVSCWSELQILKFPALIISLK